MRNRIFTSIMMFFALAITVGAQSFVRQWDKSKATGEAPLFNTPAYFEGFTTRGLAATADYLFVASRSLTLNAQNKTIKYLNAKTGADIGTLNVDAVTAVGHFMVSDVDVSDDGQILVCNMAMNAGQKFRVYKWENVTATPTVLIEYEILAAPNNIRLGDLFTVKGDLTSNAVIYSGVYGKNKVARWEIVGGAVVSQSPEVIDLIGVTETGGSLNFPKIIPTGVTKNDPFYHNATGVPLRKFSADGATILKQIVPANFMASNGVEGRDNSITHFVVEGRDYIAALGIQGAAAASPAEIKGIDVTGGLNAAIDPFHSLSLGATPNNAQLNGDIASTVIDGNVWVFLLYGNEGIAAHKFTAPVPEVVVPVTETGWRRSSNPTLDKINEEFTKPLWLDGTSRAVAVGNGHIYVVNSSEGAPGGPAQIRVLDATDGSYLHKKLNVTLPNSYASADNKIRIAAIEVDDAGHILACNMRGGGQNLNIYAWDTEESDPYLLVQAGPIPLVGEEVAAEGWHQTSYYFDVKGDIKDDAVIVAARSNNAVTYRWVITAGVVQNGGVPTVITTTVAGGKVGSYGVAALESADPAAPFWTNGYSIDPTRLAADGTSLGAIPHLVAADAQEYSKTTALKYFEWESKKYLFEYHWIWSDQGRLIDVSKADLSTLGATDWIKVGKYNGQEPNPNNWGDLDYFIDKVDGSLNLITLTTNNGIRLDRFPATTVSVKDVVSDKLSAYTNPASNMLYVSHPAGVSKVDIISVTGAFVKSVSNVSSEGINISDLNKGVYFVKVATKEETIAVSKFIKK